MEDRELRGDPWMRLFLAWIAGALGALAAAVFVGWVADGFGPLEAALMVLVGVGSGLAARPITRRKHVVMGLTCVAWTLLGIVLARSLIAHGTANDLAEELTHDTNVVFDRLAAERGFPAELQASIDAAGGVTAVSDDVYDRAWLRVHDELRAMPDDARRKRVAAAMNPMWSLADPSAPNPMGDGSATDQSILAAPAFVWGGVVWMTLFNFAWYDLLAVLLALGLAFRIGAGRDPAPSTCVVAADRR